jgi:serine/threonine protein kinase
MRPRAAALLVEYMHGAADAEPPPELFSDVARAARTKLGRIAAATAASKPDRHGGFKAVYFDEERVLAVTKPLRAAVARQALLELLVQYAMFDDGFAVPAVYGALMRVCSTPIVGLYQVVSHSERMKCTLAEYLASDEHASLDEREQTNALVAMLCAVCRTLSRLAGEFQIRHGDLKPDNIMQRDGPVSKRDPTSRWCLIDFGQVKATTAVGADIFFLLWWLVNVYKRHVPAPLLAVLTRSLKVPEQAVRGVLTPPPIAHLGVVSFADALRRAAPIGDDAWSKQHGLTKTELYAVQRHMDLPALDPLRFVRSIRKLYVRSAS